MKTTVETLKGYIEGAVKKTQYPLWKLILLGIMAGMFIGSGAALSNVAMHAIPSASLSRVPGGCIFPIGLMLIVFLGGELFTGDCMVMMACMQKKVTVLQLVKLLIIVWLTNMIGGIVMALLILNSGQLEYSAGILGAYTIKVALGKVSVRFLGGVCSGILCNIFVCAAVLMAEMAKDMVGKIFAIFFPIMVFVVGGFEHCVVNMYYIPAGILASENPKYAEIAMKKFGITAEQLSNLNVTNFLLKNELPVTIGNIIGGMVFVGLALVLLNRKELAD